MDPAPEVSEGFIPPEPSSPVSEDDELNMFIRGAAVLAASFDQFTGGVPLETRAVRNERYIRTGSFDKEN